MFMDRHDQLEPIPELFQNLRYGHGIFPRFVDDCFDANFNLLDVPIADLQTELEGCKVEDLLAIAEALVKYLRVLPAFGEGNPLVKETNILAVLEKADVPLREFLAALTAFIYIALKSKRPDGDHGVAARGCISGAIFFLLLTATRGSIPASLHGTLGATLAIQSLYTKSLEVLALPDSWETKKPSAKRGRPLVERRGNDMEDLDGMDLMVETDVQWEETEPVFLDALVLFVRNLDLSSVEFHLARPCRVLANTWKRAFSDRRLVFDDSPDLSGLSKRPLQIAKFFSLLLSLKQKNLPENLEVVFWSLEPAILRLSDTLTSYVTITKPVDTFANNVIDFCTVLIRKFSDEPDCDEVVERFLKDLFYMVPDITEYRRRLAETFVGLLDVVKPVTRLTVIRWMAEEGDADRVRSRAFVLNVMQVVWSRNWQDVNVPYLKCTSRQAVVLEICIRRLRDKSAKIRGGAASVLSALLQSDADAFDHLVMEQQDDGPADGRPEPNRIDTLFSTIISGIADVSVISRKAYLLMLGRLLLSNFPRFNQDVKEALLRVAQDPAKSMRTTVIDVICDLVQTQEIADILTDLWIRGVFHLYMDSEDTVKERVMTTFQTFILEPIFGSAGAGGKAQRLAWKLVEQLARDEQGEIRLLRQMLFDLEKAKIVTVSTFKRLQEFTTGENRQTAWILLAEVAAIISKPDTRFAFAELENSPTFEGSEDIIGACVFRVISAGFLATSKQVETKKDDNLIRTQDRDLAAVQTAFSDIKGVATVVEAVRAISAGFSETNTFEFNQWAEERLDRAYHSLQGLFAVYDDWLRTLRNTPADPDQPQPIEMTPEEVEISFFVRLIAELGMQIGLGKEGKSVGPDAVDIRGASGILSLVEKICDFAPSATGCRPWVRAHAIFGLGRLCLSAKKLTWKHSTKFIDLANSQSGDVGLRRDAIVVVFDLLKMFGDVIEKDLGKVYGWLADRNSAVRGDVINHLHDLLLNEHLQWNPAVFYQFLTSISDPSPTIREWVRSCLRSLMKKRNQCFTDFSEAVVFLNGCTEHPRFKVTEKLNSQGVAFPLAGRERSQVEKRLDVYSFMLRQLTDDQKRLTYARILEQILMPVVTREVQIEVQRYYRDVLLDVIRILGLKEMEFSVFIKQTEEDENEEEAGEGENDAEHAEEEALLKQQKLSKAARKEIWIKFRQEIVQRALLPVLLSVYRQVRNIMDAPELSRAVVELVDSLTRSAEFDLSELAQSTAGFDGQVLKAIAMDIKRMEKPAAAVAVATPAPPVTPAPDDIPLIRESPMASIDAATEPPTPTPLFPAAKVKSPSKDNGKNKTIKKEEKPVKQEDITRKPRGRPTRSKRPAVVESEDESEDDPQADTMEEAVPEADDDTLTEMATKSTRKTRTVQPQSGDITMGPPRAISTPNKNRTMNVTFGADISLIEAAPARTLRNGRKVDMSRVAK